MVEDSGFRVEAALLTLFFLQRPRDIQIFSVISFIRTLGTHFFQRDPNANQVGVQLETLQSTGISGPTTP